MVGEILKIKTNIPPLGTNILALPRILESLDEDLTVAEGFTRQLTLFSAPAGFGKTTLARKWLAGRETQTAWYSLDERDNEPERFWLYFITALQKLKPGLGSGLLEILRSKATFTDSSSSGEALLTPLLNELFTLEEPSFLILDDYHLINNPRIHEDMVFFFENLPPTLHLALTTRSDPPWPLSRWRVKGKMAEVRLKDLRLSEEEAGKMLESLKGIRLSNTQLHSLYLKTEGWVTGLQLAAFSLATANNLDSFIDNFAGSHRHVLYFLSEEVLSGQPEPVQKFLLQTSILERFSAPLCDAVTDRKDSSSVLSSLERDNLFVIPLDEDGIWYRYHQLFADLLLYQLKRNHPEKVHILHERAVKWFLEAGEPAEAVRHALADDNLMEAGRILHNHYGEILQNEGPGILYRYVNKFPLDLLKQYPRLIAHNSLFNLITQGQEEARTFIEIAETLRYDDQVEQDEYLGILNAVKAYDDIYSHRFHQALDKAEKALALLPRHSHYWRMNLTIYFGDARLFSGNPKEAYPFYLEAHRNSKKLKNQFLSLTAGFKVATSLYYLGKLEEAEELTHALLSKAKSEGLARVPRIGLLWTLLGEILREKGDLDEAAHCIERGLIFSEPEKPCLGWNYLYKIALSFSQGAYDQALETIRQIERLNFEVKLPLFIKYPAMIWEGRILVESGKLEKARELFAMAGIGEGREVQGGQENGCLALSRLLLTGTNGNLAEVRRLLEQVENLAVTGGHQKHFIETMLVKAILEEKEGFPEASENCLIAALEAGLAGGYAQLFFDERNRLTAIFTRIINKMDQEKSPCENAKIKAYARELSGIISPERQPSPDEGHGEALQQREKRPGHGLIEELSPRELEVIRLISDGLSNEAIAKQLFLSLGTVKWHTTNIYGKLGVRGRTEAAALARKLNLIV